MTDYAYGPGEWTALAHGGRAAILDPAIDAEAVTRIWESLSQGGSLESWLEVLAGNGLASLPSFGFVEPGEDGVRVVVRGAVTAVVDDHEISAGGMRTWREHVAPADTGVVLHRSPGEVSYPLIGGIVLASTLQVGEVVESTTGDDDGNAPAEPDDAEPSPSADGTADDAAMAGAAVVVGEESVDDDEPEATADESEDAVQDESGAQDENVAQDEDTGEGDDVAQVDAVEPDFVLDEDDEATEAAEAAEAERTDAVAEAGAEGEPEGEWADDAVPAQLQDLPDGQEAAGEAPLAPPAYQPWAVPTPVEVHANQWGPPGQQAEEQSFEQQPQPEPQPWQQAAAPPEPQPWQQPQPEQQDQQPQDEAGDHDGYTMRAADLPQAEEPPVDHTLAPAHEDEGGGATSQGPVMQLSLSTGQQVELDRSVLIGRAPESSRFGFGETPRLVTVPSPQQDISRTHVEIKLEGDSVLVTDLRSTNGTVVVLPGSPPRRLHPGESVPVPTGTVIDLGDGVTAVVGLPGATAPIAY